MEINELCKLNNLGEVLSIEPITGGLMHVMYKVETTNGCYAIKKLNNKIMDTQDKIDDYNESERVANFVNNHGIKVSCALKTSNGYISNINDNKYVIYKYLNGKVLDDDITIDHCRKIGNLIARLHQLDYHELGYEEKLFKFTRQISFEELVIDPRMDNMIYKDKLLNRYKDYQEIYNKANESYNNITTYLTLCHNDIFQPNVLWENSEPILIDFETSKMGSPLRELACTAIHFSGFDSNKFDEEKYKAVIEEYSKKININTDDYESIVYSELIWKIGWLRHCVQRSLGIKAINEQEIINDTKEVSKMIDQIDRYITLIPKLSNLFNEVLNSKKVL